MSGGVRALPGRGRSSSVTSFCRAPSFGERLSVAGSSLDGSSAEPCGSTRGSSLFPLFGSSFCTTRGASRGSWRPLPTDRLPSTAVLTAPLLVDRLALGIQERAKDALATIPASTLGACARTSVAAAVRAMLIDAMSATAYDEPLDRQPPTPPLRGSTARDISQGFAHIRGLRASNLPAAYDLKTRARRRPAVLYFSFTEGSIGPAAADDEGGSTRRPCLAGNRQYTFFVADLDVSTSLFPRQFRARVPAV